MKGKSLLKAYGPLFSVVWIAAFIFLVTVVQKTGVDLPTFWGDVYYKRNGLIFYLPFTSSGAFAAFAIAFWEMFQFVKRL